nr:hypothetical protein [uncultured Acetatifactor sp.]
MATDKNRRFLIPVTAFIMSVFLCGYGFDTHAAASVPDAVKTPDGTAAVSASSASGTKSGEQPKTRSSVRDRMRDMLDDEKDEAPSTKPSQTAKPAADAAGIESIAGLADAYAKAELDQKYCVVDVDDEHNPYAVAWDYGREYDKYVNLVDDTGMWDILFDAEFYMDAYPMLSMLYHEDEDLLLEHFQTVGVHEGRQGSEDFNVAAYMENCDGKLVKAFGENYECYYFYYALNQKTESKIDTANDGGYPVQMDIVLTALQRQEMKKINEYRDEVDVDDVATNAEFLAFADYRAWVNYTDDKKYAQLGKGHDWANDNMNALYDMMDSFGADAFAENTYHADNSAGRIPNTNHAKGYRESQEHYESMVNSEYTFAAPSNVYARWYDDGHVHHCQYDLYLDTCK